MQSRQTAREGARDGRETTPQRQKGKKITGESSSVPPPPAGNQDAPSCSLSSTVSVCIYKFLLFFFFFLAGFSPPSPILPLLSPVSGARYIPRLAWLLAFYRKLRPRAAHPRPLIGRACHSPSSDVRSLRSSSPRHRGLSVNHGERENDPCRVCVFRYY